jgi:hypothetical protein
MRPHPVNTRLRSSGGFLVHGASDDHDVGDHVEPAASGRTSTTQ